MEFGDRLRQARRSVSLSADRLATAAGRIVSGQTIRYYEAGGRHPSRVDTVHALERAIIARQNADTPRPLVAGELVALAGFDARESYEVRLRALTAKVNELSSVVEELAAVVERLSDVEHSGASTQ